MNKSNNSSKDFFRLTDEELNFLLIHAESLLNFNKILITGVNGFIGSYIAEAFIRLKNVLDLKDLTIWGIIRRNNIFVNENLNLILLSEYIKSDKDFNDFDLIIHAASPASPKQFTEFELNYANIEYLNQIITRQTNLKQVVFFSTGEVYGQNQNKYVTEDKVNLDFNDLKRSIYPEAKINGEKLLLDLSKKRNFTPRIIRLFHTFGPGIRKGDGRSISDFFWDVAVGQKPVLYTQGNSIRTYLYVADLVSAIFKILNSNTQLAYFNVGSAKSNSVKDFAKIISKFGGNSEPLLYFADGVNFEISPINSIVPDLSIMSGLGWSQKFSLEKGIELTLNWIKKNLRDGN